MKNNIRLLVGLYSKLMLVAVAAGLAARLYILLCADVAASVGRAVALLAKGALCDGLVATAAFAFVWLYLVTISDWKYRKPQGYVILTLLFALFSYCFFVGGFFASVGGVIPYLVLLGLGLWAHLYGLRMTHAKVQNLWRQLSFWAVAYLFVGVAVLDAFVGARYWMLHNGRYAVQDVRAVVFGNGVEFALATPDVVWGAILALLSAGLTYVLFKGEASKLDRLKAWQWKAATAPIIVLIAAVSVVALAALFGESGAVVDPLGELTRNGIHKAIGIIVEAM